MIKPQVLVVGAGPAGLNVAGHLARLGVAVTCIDRRAEPNDRSKALGVWPRTLEILQVGEATPSPTWGYLEQTGMSYYTNKDHLIDINFDQYENRAVVMPQPLVEDVLLQKLQVQGVKVEWNTTLKELRQSPDHVQTTLDSGGVEEPRDFAYVVAADGASSTVRARLDIPFPGSAHNMLFVVADVQIETKLDHARTHYFTSEKGVLVVCGLPGGPEHFRIFTSLPAGYSASTVDLDMIRGLFETRTGDMGSIVKQQWLSVFSVQSRHVENTVEGRCILIGDAAHIHSPAGGQGLNSGIADGFALAWRLASILLHNSKPSILNDFREERQEATNTVIRHAEFQTRLWMTRGRGKTAARNLLLKAAARFRVLERTYLPWLTGNNSTQLASYPPDSDRKISQFRLGCLVPDLPVTTGTHNEGSLRHLLMSSLNLTILCIGFVPDQEASASHRTRANIMVLIGRRLEDAESFMEQKDQIAVGTVQNRTAPRAVVLVRPDGYIAYVVKQFDWDQVDNAVKHVLHLAENSQGA